MNVKGILAEFKGFRFVKRSIKEIEVLIITFFKVVAIKTLHRR